MEYEVSLKDITTLLEEKHHWKHISCTLLKHFFHGEILTPHKPLPFQQHLTELSENQLISHIL